MFLSFGIPALSTPNFKSLVNITIGNGANDTQVREGVGDRGRWGQCMNSTINANGGIVV